MSVRTMARVWASSQHGGTELLMLLAIADFSDDDGRAYPAVTTLAEKCRMKPRNANYVLSSLKASGELEVHPNEGPRGTNLYRITIPEGVQHVAGVEGAKGMQAAAPLQSSAPLQGVASTPAKDCADPCNALHVTPATHCRQTINEPSGTTIEPPKRTRKPRTPGFDASQIALPNWLDRETWCMWVRDRKARKKAITEDGARQNLAKLDELRSQGHDPAAAIRNSVANGWQGLFPPKQGTSPSTKPRQQQHFTPDSYAAGIHDGKVTIDA